MSLRDRGPANPSQDWRHSDRGRQSCSPPKSSPLQRGCRCPLGRGSGMVGQGYRRSDRPLPRYKMRNQRMVGMTQRRTQTDLLSPLSRRSSLGRLPGRRPGPRGADRFPPSMVPDWLDHQKRNSSLGLRLGIRRNRWNPRMDCMRLQGMASERWRRCSPRNGRRESPDRWSDSHMVGRCQERKAFEMKSPRSPHSIREMPHRTYPGPVAADTFLPSRESG